MIKKVILYIRSGILSEGILWMDGEFDIVFDERFYKNLNNFDGFNGDVKV